MKRPHYSILARQQQPLSMTHTHTAAAAVTPAPTHLSKVLPHHVAAEGDGLALSSDGTGTHGTIVGTLTGPEVLICGWWGV
jgi:hypothetical protein